MPDVVACNKVKNVLRPFQSLCRKLLQTEEYKSKESSKIKRVDLTTAQIIKKNIRWVNSGGPIIGSVPGVDVGDEFGYRVELTIVDLHRPFQGGVDATKKAGISGATSIVASGSYIDDMDSTNVLIYSGSGGNPAGPDKPREVQRLELQNLALKNSIDTMTPARVIHGSKEMKPGSSHDTSPKQVSTFTYVGLNKKCVDYTVFSKETLKEKFKGLCKVIKEVLGDKVENVGVSDCVVDLPCCLIMGDYIDSTDFDKEVKV